MMNQIGTRNQFIWEQCVRSPSIICATTKAALQIIVRAVQYRYGWKSESNQVDYYPKEQIQSNRTTLGDKVIKLDRNMIESNDDINDDDNYEY